VRGGNSRGNMASAYYPRDNVTGTAFGKDPAFESKECVFDGIALPAAPRASCLSIISVQITRALSIAGDRPEAVFPVTLSLRRDGAGVENAGRPGSARSGLYALGMKWRTRNVTIGAWFGRSAESAAPDSRNRFGEENTAASGSTIETA